MTTQTASTTATVKAVPTFKLYEFNEGPGYVLGALQSFDNLARRVKKKNTMLLLVLLAASALWVGVTSNYEHAIQGSLVLCAVIFLVGHYVVTSLRHYFKEKNQLTFPTAAVFGILGLGFAGFILFTEVTAQEPTLSGKLGMIYAMLQSKHSVSDNPFLALISPLLATGLVAILFGWRTWFRSRRVSPQPAEIYFCSTILKGLLPEISPNARCAVAINPFPPEWSGIVREMPNGKKAYFDLLLSLKLALGGERKLGLVVAHRRSSKGRNKHKGWKHKVKYKYSLSIDVDRLSVSSKDKLRSRIVALARQFCEAAALKPSTEFAYFPKIPDGQMLISFLENEIVLTQSFQDISALSKDLSPKQIFDPVLILATIRALNTAVLESEQPPQSSAT